MASGWVKSFQCKSRAFEDVYHPSPKSLLPSSASCRKSTQSIKDVIETNKKKPKKPKHAPASKPHPPSFSKLPKPTKPDPPPNPISRHRHSTSLDRTNPLFSALTELPEGHPSRNVVEIIFHTSWTPKAFTGRVEMIFKVQNGSKTVARFEEYREVVKSRAGSGSPTDGTTWEENARCVADGNEVMRFHCLGPSSGSGAYDAAWALPCGKGAGICTFSGSGGAHENAGGGRGRRAMLVCRVIAGRVSNQLGIDPLLDGRVGFDSVSGDNDELIVFDARAVLPCFLIIYRL